MPSSTYPASAEPSSRSSSSKPSSSLPSSASPSSSRPSTSRPSSSFPTITAGQQVLVTFSASQRVDNYDSLVDNNPSQSKNAFTQTVQVESGLNSEGTTVVILSILPPVTRFRLQTTYAVFNYNVSFVVGHGTPFSSPAQGYTSVTNTLLNSVNSNFFTLTLNKIAREKQSILS